MNKKVTPRQKLDLTGVVIGQKIEVHADVLASFKATVSRYNKTADNKIGFDYSNAGKDLFITATAKEWASRIKRTA